MMPTLWLAWRELVNRKAAFATGMGMVCAAVSLCAATELVARAREAAMAAEIDHIGPTLRLIPAGKTAKDLARFDLGPQVFTARQVTRLRREISPWTRAVEGRLLVRTPVEGRAAPVIGLDPDRTISPLAALARLGADDLALGADAARSLGRQMGGELLIEGRPFRVAAVLPETASADDVAIYLPLRTLQDLFDLPGTVNELRIFPSPGASVERITSSLSTNHPEINVINTYRGDTAERGMNRSLLRHRHVLYLITTAVISFCILIWSYLNAGERTLEMATVVAVGGTGMTVLSMLVIRAAIVGFAGALAGYLVGVLVALAQDFESARGVVLSWPLLFVLSVGTVTLSVFAASIASTFSAFRQHVTVLQEW